MNKYSVTQAMRVDMHSTAQAIQVDLYHIAQAVLVEAYSMAVLHTLSFRVLGLSVAADILHTLFPD